MAKSSLFNHESFPQQEAPFSRTLKSADKMVPQVAERVVAFGKTYSTNFTGSFVLFRDVFVCVAALQRKN
jgi:hypothetical protein